MANPIPLSPYTIIVTTISGGGANKCTHITLPPKTKLVTMFPEVDDAFITDRFADGEVVTDAHRYPVLNSGHNEMRVDGWGEGGVVLRMGSATVGLKVRILCQR